MLKLAGIVTIPYAASWIPDGNAALNILMLIVLLFGAPRFFRASRAEAALAEKDRTIDTHLQTIEADRARMDGLRSDLAGCQDRSNQLEARNRKLSEVAAAMQARYEEAARYTAREALKTLEQLLTHQSEESERRHQETTELLKSINSLLADRQQ